MEKRAIMFTDTNATHVWDGEAQNCPIKNADGTYHLHFMRCGRCGIKRYSGLVCLDQHCG